MDSKTEPRRPGPHDVPGELPGPDDPTPKIPEDLRPRVWNECKPMVLKKSTMYPGMLTWHPAVG